MKFKDANNSFRAGLLARGQARHQDLCSTFRYLSNDSHDHGFHQDSSVWLQGILQTICVLNGLVIGHLSDGGPFLGAAVQAYSWAQGFRHVSLPAGQD